MGSPQPGGLVGEKHYGVRSSHAVARVASVGFGLAQVFRSTSTEFAFSRGSI